MTKKDFIVGESYILNDIDSLPTASKHLPLGITMVFLKNRSGDTGSFEYKKQAYSLYYSRFIPATQPTLQLYPSLNSMTHENT